MKLITGNKPMFYPLYPARMPRRGTVKSAGWDLSYFGAQPVTLLSGEVKKLRTGIHMRPPEGHYPEMDNRSSVGYKKGLVLMCRTIDEDYRGEVFAILGNFTEYPVTIDPMERIVQVVFKPYAEDDAIRADCLEDLGTTERGSNGFGSTGRN